MIKKIYFKNNRGERLVGVLHVPKRPINNAGLVICHGYNDYKEKRLLKIIGDLAEQESICALRFDFSGLGESEGKFSSVTYTRLLNDLKSAIEYLRKRGINNIGLVGHSMGGAIAALRTVRDHNIKVLIGLSPVSSMIKTYSRLFTHLDKKNGKKYRIVYDKRNPEIKHTVDPKLFNDSKKYNMVKEAGHIQIPTLYFVGDRDDVVKVREVKKAFAYISCDAKKLVVLKNCYHQLRGHEKEVARQSIGWCKKYLINKESSIVVVSIRHKDKILIMKRSKKIGQFPGYWHVVAGYDNDNKPLEQAYKEIQEETGLKKNQLKLMVQGKKYINHADGKHKWIVHPFMFETKSKTIRLDWEHSDYRWIDPVVFHKYKHVTHMDRTIKELWTSMKKNSPNILLIDTTEFNTIKLYLKKGPKIHIYNKTITALKRDDLLKTIDHFITRYHIKVNELTHIAVVKGPGPFTSVRVGVTIANSLGLALGVNKYGLKKNDKFNPESIINKILTNRLKPDKTIIPFYNRKPNITKPKKNNNTRP
ncbi:alpha/beta fold hydrolase [Patescibacteria group bacterium]|nr:alpha/beta fold hydrolase [Patescibacteria group bacterium]MBU1890394.1 alpha/beta fold hydrolase [Patescibacteria group bacterium]